MILKSNSTFCYVLFLMSTEIHSIYHVEWNQSSISSPQNPFSTGFWKLTSSWHFWVNLTSYGSDSCLLLSLLQVSFSCCILYCEIVMSAWILPLPSHGPDLVTTCHTGPEKKPRAALVSWACLVLHRCLRGGCLVGEQLQRPGLAPSWVYWVCQQPETWWADLKSTDTSLPNSLPTCVIKTLKFYRNVYAVGVYHNHFLDITRSSKNTWRKQLPLRRCFGFFLSLTFVSMKNRALWLRFIRHLKPDRFQICIACVYFLCVCVYEYIHIFY